MTMMERLSANCFAREEGALRMHAHSGIISEVSAVLRNRDDWMGQVMIFRRGLRGASRPWWKKLRIGRGSYVCVVEIGRGWGRIPL